MTPFDLLLAFEAVVIITLILACLALSASRDRLLARISRGVGGVDPWRLQRTLMEASDQPIAKAPAITKTTLLYWALIHEELAETTDAIIAGLDARGGITDDREFDMLRLLHLSSRQQEVAAVQMRKWLSEGPFEDVLLQREDAIPLLDGTTDIAVVNAGLCLASGLPGSEAYLEVLTSNLSKRNADGKIDKHPDGKWIKGPNYVEPNLDYVILTAT